MRRAILGLLAVSAGWLAPFVADAQPGSSGVGAAIPPPAPTSGQGAVAGAVAPSSGPLVIGPPPGFYYVVPGPYGPMPYIPPTYVIAPGGGFPPALPPVVTPAPAPTPFPRPFDMRIHTPPDPVAEATRARVRQGVLATAEMRAAASTARASRGRNPERAELMVTIGDRLFVADNLKRAVERYEQAIRADPADPNPRLRLAQVAVKRGDYAEAAHRLREAQAADPGWLLEHPFDIQGLYPEPADFAAMIHTIESHLITHPHDRDAWLVLGAQLYLSGRTRRSADVFLRLTDRKPDPTLSAFLDASRALE